jgi:serine/threonine-protein kinase
MASTNELEQLTNALADHYRIKRELGRGGMAVVYLAEDRKHDRQVAVKVVHPELASLVGADRFLNEIRVTAKLHHPNIVQLHDSGVADGIMYYVMPFVDGESLRDRLDRDGALPIDEAVSIACSVASALDYAHRHGVVHRDVKPANIMLQEGTPLVADFGIALALDAVSDERMTQTGMSLGTPSYMSPEQAAGEKRITAESDVYAIGAMLYEMLAGEPPFTGANMRAIVARIMSEPPRKLRVIRGGISPELEAAVERALAKEPADRFHSAAAFADALRPAITPAVTHAASAVPTAATPARAHSPRTRRARSLIATSVLAIGVLGVALLIKARAGRAQGDATSARDTLRAWVNPTDDPRPAIAVLSFVNMNPGDEQKYFSDGISEEILTALSRIRDLRVAARSTALTYQGKDLDLRQVGKSLGVRYLLAGSVRKEGDRVRITAELVNAADGFRVWSDSYDRQLQNVFAIQSEIAGSIADALRVPLGLAARDMVRPTMDTSAHDLYLLARAAMRRRGRGVREAVRLFEAAAARDSAWAPAWGGLAEARALLPGYYDAEGMNESQDSTAWDTSLRGAEVAARRALALDPNSAAAHIALGGVHRDRWEWTQGEAEYRRALQLDPDSHEAHQQYAELLWGMGRLDEALRECERAVLLDRAPVRFDTWGLTLYMNRRFADSERVLEEGLAMDTAGDVHWLRKVLARQMLFDGRYAVALRRFARFLDDTAGYRMQGEALAARDPTRLPRGAGRVHPVTWMLLGNPERAMNALHAEAYELPFRVQYNIWDPHLAPLWSTPRFRDDILTRLRLPGAVAKLTTTAAGS